MNRTAWVILVVVLIGAWLIGFSSLAVYLYYRNVSAPAANVDVSTFQIQFGLLQNDGQNNYSLSEETTTIPMKFGDSTYGFKVIPPDDTSYSVQFVIHFPYPPKIISGNVFESNTPSKDMRSVTTTMQGNFVEDLGFDPGDPSGDQSIDIYIDGKLARTIKFTVTPPAQDQK